ncbi:tetratricopeptide repeat protein [Thiothrix subterranea]|uniref:Tetratricopeptide repeat protein n=1 Tax=Thiothrix subterranea TaxID=2735563 RepID=A0AA51MM30_9GAMM|nr:tetratricopeptide repeat protein [Thiothrix subterranea]MDQ5768846.1 tetratricopeptide repeat protein [Thiothrix subterranea]WML86473.1 tetratricopeptide repeat protein [Thiothrix subterranea]
MTLNPRYFVGIPVALAGLLSACSPNPMVLQDRVSTVRPVVVPPRVSTPAPAVKPELNSSSEVVIPKKPVVSVAPKPKPVAPVVPTEVISAAPPVPEPVEVLTPKAYPSSPAVKALMKTADAEAVAGNFDKAADTLERALRIESDNPDIWLKLAKINERQGNREQAANMLSKAKTYQEQLN